MVGDRWQESDERGQTSCVERKNRTSLSRCRRIYQWKQRAESMTYCKAIVSDLLEKHATPKQKADHIDIADWIIFQIQEGKLMSTANHLVEAEKILQQMIEKNPVLQKLIDELDLVLVDASHIASDDKSPP